jgi:hypothetical protein
MLRSMSTISREISAARLRAFLLKKWKVPAPSRQNQALLGGVALLAHGGRPKLRQNLSSLHVVEQAFDAHLLSFSPLYGKARRLFLEAGGRFRPAMVSSPRSLGSPTLLDMTVEYSPLEREYLWAAVDPLERRNQAHLFGVRFYVTSLFHEQNHRTLWTMLPPAPALKTDSQNGPRLLKRYLNMAESLIIGLDMALGDELGPTLANLFYLTGATYDPGSTVRQEIGSSRKSASQQGREYKNYLQAACYATYLNLELYDEEQIKRAITALFPSLGKMALRAARRGASLDEAFVFKTNPSWQRKHLAQVSQVLSKKGNPGLRLPNDPLDNREYYLFAEKWFSVFGL